MSLLDISLETANSLYKWGWRGSIVGAVITAVAVAALMWGTRVRDRDFENRMTESYVVAGQAHERASAADERAAILEKETAQLRLDLEKEREKSSARFLRPDQIAEIQKLKGKIDRVNITWVHNNECTTLAVQIAISLRESGITVEEHPSRAGSSWIGVQIFESDTTEPRRDPTAIVTAAFVKAKVYYGGGPLTARFF
jgi:hypothetical protein